MAQKRINPADGATFPWLSGVARKYEKYRFRKLKFTMVPHAPTTASGTLGMYVDYDPSDVPAPTAAAFLKWECCYITDMVGDFSLCKTLVNVII